MNNLIKEFTEFNNMRMNSDSVPQSTHVDDPSISFGSYNRFQMNLSASIDKLNSIYQNFNITSSGISNRDGSRIQLKDLKNIKCLKINKVNDLYYDLYFTLFFGEKEYYGVIRKVNTDNPSVSCEIFKDTDLFLSREFIIRVKGNILKAFKIWFTIKNGKYVCLRDLLVTNTETGELVGIKSNDIVEVINCGKDNIKIYHNDVLCSLNNENFFFFNYWFEKEEK